MNRWIACFSFFCMFVLFLPGPVPAQENGGDNDSVTKLEEVVVTATRQEEEISSVPANVSLITENDIENSPARNVPELLRNEVGVHVKDIMGNRRSYTIDLRGFGETAASNTLVLIDGRRINPPDLTGVDWTLISKDRIKRIEIIRGGRGSVLYGDNAAGGVINIITKEGRGFHAEADVAGGSYDTWEADAQISGMQKGLSFALTGSYLTSDGYRDNSDTRAKDVGINLGYLAAKNLKLNFSSGYHEDSTGLPGAIRESQLEAGVSRTDTFNPDDFADTEDYYVKMSPEIYFLNDSLFKMDVSYRNRDYDASYSFGFREQEIDTVSVSPQLIYREKLFGHQNNLTLGMDFIDDEAAVESSFGAEDNTKESLGFYIHEEFHATKRLSLSGGYRYDEVEYTFEPGPPERTEYDENLYTAGINYNFHRNSYVYFGFSRSFRYPALDEITWSSGVLKPQTSDDYELGIRHHFSETFYCKVNLFRIDTDDEIYYNPITTFNENFDGETRRNGMEISLSKKFAPVHLKGTYSYTDAAIESGPFDGNDFPGVPEHQASFTSTFYPIKNLTVAVNGTYVGERPFISDFENEYPDQEDYFVANTKIQYQWNKMRVYLNVNNLFDEEYSEYGVLGFFPEERAYYPSPEINFMLGVSMEL